jgi:hypothetical protein
MIEIFEGSCDLYTSSFDDFAFNWETDYDTGGPCTYGEHWGAGNYYGTGSKPSRVSWRIQAEWEIDGRNYTKTKSGSVYISWSNGEGSASLPDVTFS